MRRESLENIIRFNPNLPNDHVPAITAFVVGSCFGSQEDLVACFVRRFCRLDVFSHANGIVYASQSLIT